MVHLEAQRIDERQENMFQDERVDELVTGRHFTSLILSPLSACITVEPFSRSRGRGLLVLHFLPVIGLTLDL